VTDDIEYSGELRRVLQLSSLEVDLPPGLGAAARRAGQRRAASITGAALLSLVAVGVGAVRLAGTEPAKEGRQTVIAGQSPSRAPSPGPGRENVSFHGLTLTVPATWTVGGSRCASTGTGVVVFDDEGAAACDNPGSSGVEVHLSSSDNPAGTQYAGLTTRDALVDGVPARRGSGRVLPSSPLVEVLYVPSLHAVVAARAPSGTSDLLTDVHVASYDSNGCAGQLSELARSASAPDDGQPLLPPSPSSLTICRYVATWLVRSIADDPDQRRTVERVLMGLPREPNPDPATTCPKAGVEELIIHAEYADGDPVDVTASVADCVRRASSAQRTRGISRAFLNLVVAAVGSDDSVGDISTLPEG
jgi:hypothetical protein